MFLIFVFGCFWTIFVYFRFFLRLDLDGFLLVLDDFVFFVRLDVDLEFAKDYGYLLTYWDYISGRWIIYFRLSATVLPPAIWL